MKKTFAAILFSLSAVSFAYINLLTDEDWEYLQYDITRPAITLPVSGESYYNKWTCHLTENLEIEIVSVIYDEKKMGSPTIIAKIPNGIIEYALDPEPMLFSNRIKSIWTDLIRDTEEVCLVSAFLQVSSESEIRIVQRIKTHHGIWDWFEESKSYEGLQRKDI